MMKEKDNKNLKNEFRFITPFTKDVNIIDAEPDDMYLGYITGKAATNDLDRYGDIITEKALINGARDLLANPTVFEDHNYDVSKAVGKVMESKVVTIGTQTAIFVKVAISKTANELWTKIKEGIIRAFSIGGIWKETEYDKERDIWLINDMELWELSIVGVPANPSATFGSLGLEAMKFIKSMKSKDNDKETGEKNMTEEPEWMKNFKNLIEKFVETQENTEKSIVELKKQLDNENKQAPQIQDSNTELKQMVKDLAVAVKPIVTEYQKSVELAERKSAALKEKKAQYENMSYQQKLKLGMQQIIQATQDPLVDEVVLLGELEFVPPYHKRSIEDIRKSIDRATNIY